MYRTLSNTVVVQTVSILLFQSLLHADEPWKQAKLKNIPQSYGTVSASGDSVTQVGQFTDKSITYQVLEEKDKFVRITDGKNSGWCFKISLERVASPAPETPADIPSSPEEPDWVKQGTAPPKLTDPYQGINVFLKDTAIAKVGNQVIERSKIHFPSQVGDVNGEWLWVGRGWVRKSDVRTLQEAFDFYVDEVRNNPKTARSWYGRAVCWFMKGELDSAIKDLDEAIRLDSKQATYYTGRATAKNALKDHTGAIADYDEAIRVDPRHALAYNNRGSAKSDLRDYTGAIADYNEAIRLDPKSATAYINRGIAKITLKDYLEAIVDLDEAIRLDPKFATAYINRGIAKINHKDYSGAIRDYDEAIRIDPKDPMAYNGRGWSKMLTSDWNEAIRDLDEAMRLNPKGTYSINSKSILLSTCPEASMRDGNMAAELAERALKLGSKSSYSINARACAYAAAGDFMKAIEWQKRAMEDEDFMNDDSVLGGKSAQERIAKWEAEELWLLPSKQ